MLITSSEFSEANIASADVCIIGAGAAGITLACELDGTPLRVVLLEAGGLHTDTDNSDFYGGTATSPHPNLTQFRRVAFGGTTSLWGGRCVPLDPIDFEKREYIANSGWPIPYTDIAAFYPRAMSYCDAGDCDFTVAGSLADATETIPGFDGGNCVLTDRLERYSLPTDFGRRYRKKIADSRNVTAILYARCVGLYKSTGDDSIDAVGFLDRSQTLRRMRCRVVVLSTGGIEVPRILMNSDLAGSGLGNRHDILGRYYSCHFENICGRLVSGGTRVAFNFERTIDGVYCRRQLRFSEDAQRQNSLRNMAFRLHFPEYSDASHHSSVMSAIYLAKSFLPAEHRAILNHGQQFADPAPLTPHLRNIFAGLPALAKFAGDYLFKIRLARRKIPYTLIPNADGSYPLEFNCEQTPTANNRVTLTQDIDRSGLKRAHVSWSLCSADVESAHRGFLLLRAIINRHSACRVHFDENKLLDYIRASHPLGGHHIGTARMGHSERSGVVGSDCAVFGLPNLYIASSAVFPTSGYANPTLSIVALALRLAGTLKSRL
jgi:choline dehydrogenase-like flavoprotein